MNAKKLVPYLQVAPLTLVLLFFLIAPLALVLTVSVFKYIVFIGLQPAFNFDNYRLLLTNVVNYQLFLSTLKFTLIVLVITAFLGFWLAYFLVFHVRSLLIAIGLFLVCTVNRRISGATSAASPRLDLTTGAWATTSRMLVIARTGAYSAVIAFAITAYEERALSGPIRRDVHQLAR